jgi:hypothetical protein
MVTEPVLVRSGAVARNRWHGLKDRFVDDIGIS